jgi:hypothetical protein
MCLLLLLPLLQDHTKRHRNLPVRCSYQLAARMLLLLMPIHNFMQARPLHTTAAAICAVSQAW